MTVLYARTLRGTAGPHLDDPQVEKGANLNVFHPINTTSAKSRFQKVTCDPGNIPSSNSDHI